MPSLIQEAFIFFCLRDCISGNQTTYSKPGMQYGEKGPVSKFGRRIKMLHATMFGNRMKF